MNQEKIGKFIYDLRKKYNLTQAELASRLHVTAQAISKWENGRGVPDIELLKKLSEEFNVSISELIEGKEEKKKSKMAIIVSLSIISMILITTIAFLILTNQVSTFNFSSLICDNESFSLNGVIAYNSNKKSIYISNIEYCDKLVAETKFINVECILYENTENGEREIAKLGNLDMDSNSGSKYLSELLENIEFNIDDYDCNCNSTTCNSLHITINALNDQNEITTYNIPIEIDYKCNN